MTVVTLTLGLRTRILMLVLLAAVLPAAMVTGLLFNKRNHDIELAQRNLGLMARNASTDLRSRIQGTHQLLFGLSQSSALDTDSRETCSAYLAEVLKQYPQYTGILTIKPDGQLHCDSLRSGRTLSLTDRGYFKKAMSSTGPAIEAAFGRLTGAGVVQIARAARDARGNVRFVLLASLDLNQFAREALDAQPYSDTVINLLDSDGTVLATHGRGTVTPRIAAPPAPGQSLKDSRAGRFASAGLDGDTADFAGLLGVRRIWALGKLSGAWDPGVSILLGVRTEVLAADAQRRTTEAVAAVVGTTLLALLLAWALAETGIRRPLARVMRGTARLGNGELDARIGPPYPRGEIGELMHTLDDTARKIQAQQEEIQRLNTGLEEHVRVRTAELETVNQELQAFSYSLAHDLRQPLISIGGFTSQLLKLVPGGGDERARHFHDRIQAGIAHINELSDAMVALARLSRTELVREPVDISALANAALGACRLRNPARAAQFHVQDGLQVVADRAMVTAAIAQLVDNAWKFTGRQVQADISIGSQTMADGTVAFCIRDNGDGFDMSHADKLFTAFQRLHLPEDFPGTGVGLATVQKIVARHGGKVWAQSAPGQGATVYFTLTPAGGAVPSEAPSAT